MELLRCQLWLPTQAKAPTVQKTYTTGSVLAITIAPLHLRAIRSTVLVGKVAADSDGKFCPVELEI
eukprot:3196880-Ditylum_brightwellii.AAC.1